VLSESNFRLESALSRELVCVCVCVCNQVSFNKTRSIFVVRKAVREFEGHVLFSALGYEVFLNHDTTVEAKSCIDFEVIGVLTFGSATHK